MLRHVDTSARDFAWVYYATATLVAGLVVCNVYVAVIAFTFAKVREDHDEEEARAAAFEAQLAREASALDVPQLTAAQHYELLILKDQVEVRHKSVWPCACSAKDFS